MPEPLLPVAIVAKSKTDEDKLSVALGRLVAEDPTMRLENNAETHQLVLWCMGEAHADVLLDRLSSRYGVSVDTVALRVPLRETVATAARGLGRNVKQTGGHGEYGICQIEVEPLPNGAGFEFVDKIVGGVVPRQFIPSVEKGVRAQLEQGVLAGYPMTGVRVTLFDGKAHSVDSSDMAFQKAGRAALQRRRGEGVADAARAGRRGVHPGAGRVRRGGHVGPVGPARRGCSAPSRSASAGRWSAPRCPSWRSRGTRSNCVRSRTGQDRSRGDTCGTSRSRRTWPPR